MTTKWKLSESLNLINYCTSRRAHKWMIHFQDRIKNGSTGWVFTNPSPRFATSSQGDEASSLLDLCRGPLGTVLKKGYVQLIFSKTKIGTRHREWSHTSFCMQRDICNYIVRSNSQKTHIDTSICNSKVLTILQPFDFRWSYSIYTPKVSDLASTLMEQTGSYVTWMVCVLRCFECCFIQALKPLCACV